MIFCKIPNIFISFDRINNEKFLSTVTSVDLWFAFYCVSDFSLVEEDTYLLFIYTSYMYRLGNMCISLDLDLIDDSWKYLYDNLVNGWVCCSSIDKNKLFIEDENGFIYLKSIYAIKNSICKNMLRISNSLPRLLCNINCDHLILNDRQICAINLVQESSIAFISGGPGTGKTYTISNFIREYIKIWPFSKILITAPTGKAVANLKTILGKLDINSLYIVSGTLHSILLLKEDDIYLNYDLIIVDESSMIDAVFFDLLLKKTSEMARLVLIGDANQLSSVGVGSIFKDLLVLFKEKAVFLNQSLRTSCENIKSLSKSVLQGEIIQYEELSNINEFVSLVVSEFIKNELVSSNVCVLTPLQKGLWGVSNLNQLIYKRLSLTNKFISSIPIVINKNIPILDLWNGDMGVLCLSSKKAYFSNNRVIEEASLPGYDYNYVTSIHKSQGSEFDSVFIIIPVGSKDFCREILYTAITRAKINVRIFADEYTLKHIIKKQSKRLSGLISKQECLSSLV